MRGEWREFSDRSGWLAILIPICALGLAFGPDQFPLVTIRAFLIPMAALLVGLATWMLKKHYLYMGISTIFAACLVLVPPARVFLQAKDKVRSTSLWTIAQMNVHEPNTSFAQVVATARATGADLLSMQEIDTTWRKRLDAGLSDLYPWHIHGAGERNYGIALYSNMPLEQAEVMELEGLPTIRAVVGHQNSRVQVLAVHLRAPESSEKLSQRNTQWNSLAELVQKADIPVCLIGDLNTVPWDEAYKRFTARTGMRTGPWSLIPTWPAMAGTAVIPLDHILTTSGLCMLGVRAFSIPGSDHRGLWTNVQVPVQDTPRAGR